MINYGPIKLINKRVHIDRIYQFEHLLLIENYDTHGLEVVQMVYRWCRWFRGSVDADG